MQTNFNGTNIEVNIIDNKAKVTLLCIHGFGSSKDFIKDFGKRGENFNVVSFTVPLIDDMSVDYMVSIAEFILSKIKNSQVYVLGHSLGGAVASRLKSKKIKRYFFVSTVHPYIKKFNPYRLLKTALNPKNSLQSVVGSVAFVAAKKIPNTDVFVDHHSPWFNIVKNELIKPEFIHRLDQDLKKIANPTVFVGNEDKVISTKYLVEYAKNELKTKPFILEGKHNIFENVRLTKLFNDTICFKKRFFFKFRKIFSL